MNKREKGKTYELLAASFLEKNGYQIICQNFRSHFGEIDIIAKDKDYYVFIEVKYRKNTNAGFPIEAVNKNKIYRIQKTAQYYLYINNLKQYTKLRFDIISILDEEIEIIKNAF